MQFFSSFITKFSTTIAKLCLHTSDYGNLKQHAIRDTEWANEINTLCHTMWKLCSEKRQWDYIICTIP